MYGEISQQLIVYNLYFTNTNFTMHGEIRQQFIVQNLYFTSTNFIMHGEISQQLIVHNFCILQIQNLPWMVKLVNN